MSLRSLAAVAAGRATARVIRRTGLGGGTALPGVLALTLAPQLLGEAAARIPLGSIVIAGTNGKTTTARLVAGALQRAGLRVVHNRSGSNLPRGIAATLIETSDWLGHPHGDIAVFEADEFALRSVVPVMRPRLLLLLNLFRDQLDRYGELQTIAREWARTLDALPPDALLAVDADDPLLAALTEPFASRRWTFGLDDPACALETVPHAADWRTCPRCSGPLEYERAFLGHLGDYRCARCDFARPSLRVKGLRVEQRDGGSRLEIHWEGRRFTVESPLLGVYNAYNLLAAVTAGLALGFAPDEFSSYLGCVPAAFGRQERLTLADRTITLLLVKNPTGFNEVVRLVAASPQRGPILILINDLDADGRDVSWLWDVDLEPLRELGVPISTGGLRSAEMALRLAYAGIEPVARYSGVREAFDHWLETLPGECPGWVLATYTAMLELRRSLADRGIAPAFWEQ